MSASESLACSGIHQRRVLVVGARGPAGPLMRTVLAAAGVGQIILIEEPRRALEMLCAENFDAVFLEAASSG